MNKPAAKEPSMDEILSSIRQIIADDDDAIAEEEAVPEESEPVSEPVETPMPSFDDLISEEIPEEAGSTEPEPEAEPEPEIEPESSEDEPLALSLDQVVEAEAVPDLDSSEDEADVKENIDFSLADDVAFVMAEEDDTETVTSAPGSGTMPDPNLSGEIADHLLDQTTQAAASQAFARLGTLGLGAENKTIEGVVRELLRPMLKAWLDENLPSVVERLVEREIERVSRGGR